jgi:chloramphenicol-sensitive protein RarD
LALALLGVVWLTVQAGQLPWIALVLASSFGVYGLLRKIASLGPLEGLTLETLMLAPPALVALWVLAARGEAAFPSTDLTLNAWLVGFGPTTAVPLLLFAAGARRLTLATMGVLQYLSPTLQLMLGLWVFHEPFSASRTVGFVAIWTALVLYSLDGWRASRRGRAVHA